jgi:hypothetical protein
MAVRSALAVKSSSQSITTSFSALVTASEVLDTIAGFDTATSTSRMVVSSNYNTRYGRHGFSANVSNVSNEMEGRKNGSSYLGRAKHNSESTGTNTNSGMGAPIVLATSDYFEAMVRNFSGTNNSSTNELCWSMLEIMRADFNGALVKKSVDQALSATTTTTLTWDQEEYDLNGWHDNSVDNSRLTVPAVGVELVRVYGNIEMPASTDQTVLSTIKNGANAPGLPAMDIKHGSSRQRFINIFGAPIAVAPGDYFEMQAYNQSAQSVVAGDNTWFGIERLPRDLKYCLLSKTADQSIAASTNTPITFDTEVADVGGWHSTLSNTDRLTVPIGVSRVRVTAGIKGSNVANQFVPAIWKNGAVTYAGAATRDNDTDGQDYSNLFTAIIAVVPGDYFQLIGWSSTARDIIGDADTWFSIEEVRGEDEYDDHLSNVVFHLVPTGADDSVVITDQSPAAHGNGTVTNQAHIETSIAKFGTALQFDGANDRIDWADHADWRLGPTSSDPWTIDLWCRIADNTSHLDYVIGQRAGAINANTTSWSLVIVNGLLEMNGWTGTTNWQVAQTTGLMAINTWYHVAVDKDSSGKVRLYLDGVMVASGTPADSSMFDTTTALSVGNPIDNSLDFFGGMSSLRLTKGFARYASDSGFTRPEAPAPLTAPGVTNISPVGGPTTGGTLVMITGGNFLGTTDVTFGGVSATGIVVYQEVIFCYAPAGSLGPVDVEVVLPGPNFIVTDGYTYTDMDPAVVTSVTPDKGKSTGGTPVTIVGDNFTGATVVNFGGVPATSVVVVDDETITAVTPANLPGLVDVQVIGTGGDGLLEDGFEFTNALRLTQVPILLINLPNQAVRVTQLPLLVVSLPAQGSLITQMPHLVVWTPTPIPLPLPIVPEMPVTETWEWKTTLNIAERGKEQRSALRAHPRMGMTFDAFILNDEDRQTVYQMMFKYIKQTFNYPMYHYSAKLTAAAAAGATKLFFNPLHTDLRDNETVAIFDPHLEKTLFLNLGVVDADGANLATALPFDVPEYFLICPAPRFKVENPSFSMNGVDGGFTMNLEGAQVRNVLRADQSTSLTLIDGMPLLDKRPLADSTVDEHFDQNVVWIDNKVADPEPKTNWFAPLISGDREFLVHRPGDMDFWRAFASALRGRQNPFLLPTFRDDLPLYSTPALGATSFQTSNVQFFDFWRSKAWRYVRIQSDAGVIYRRINEVVDHYDADGNPIYMTVKLSASIGAGAGANSNMVISFVNTVRMDSDTITLEHGPVDTVLSMKVRMIEE